MRIQHFYTTPEGGSRFGEIEIALTNAREDSFGHIILCSTPFVSPRVSVVELPAGLYQDWHCAPERQLVVVLDGSLEVESTDGETRRWRKGECFLADDTGGSGHRTRTLGGRALLLFAPVAPDFSLDAWQR
jgi:hypothetical protein